MARFAVLSAASFLLAGAVCHSFAIKNAVLRGSSSSNRSHLEKSQLPSCSMTSQRANGGNAQAHVESILLQMFLKLFWRGATVVGLRRLGRLVKTYFPAYRDTTFYFEQANGYVALTIDDGLSRGGNETSLLPEILDLLKKYEARATFFVCTKYTCTEDAQKLLVNGHGLGNHLREDKNGFYHKLSREKFLEELLAANTVLDAIDGGRDEGRWFRAPQGRMTRKMREVLASQNMRHVLADCYCDDWALSDPRYVSSIMLSQVCTGGSIAVFHMPERGFRESSLQALSKFLEGTKARGLKCVNLSEMAAIEEQNATPRLTR